MSGIFFHAGERAAHALAGGPSPNAAIRDYMSDQHRAFFELLPFLTIATTDRNGAPIATILTGAPGFTASPDPASLTIAALPDWDDPAAASFVPGAPVGILGIDLATRRRNRVNGVLDAVGPSGMTVSVAQSFGNCPQYIQTRFWRNGARDPRPVEHFNRLTPTAHEAIKAADTFFVASSSGDGDWARGGVDVSHRGGLKGFVAVDENTLTIPDFHGNGYFNTFGNLLLDPRTALLFVDWSSGDLLHVEGRAEILWGDARGFVGAERVWRVSVTGGWRRPGTLPLRWSFGDFAPQTLRTGTWDA